MLKPNSFEEFAVLDPSKEFKIFRNGNKLIGIYDRKEFLDSGRILNEFIQFLNIPKISTVMILPKVKYIRENLESEEYSSFIRGLDSKLANIKELKVPNFIAGLCGGGNI